jgi:acetyltransferase-like isoleucine patch superfamily enzyme
MIRILKKLMGWFNMKPTPLNNEYSFAESIEVGLNPNFHGNNKVKSITIGKHSYVTYNSIIYYCDIGNYCSIGPNVVIGYGDHPTNLLTTSPRVYYNHQIFSDNEVDTFTENNFKRVTIKNDVWIGANVFIKNGVTIGNGAIIAAGAVVLSDVGDYEIVGGIPAKLIRKRFDDEVIPLLLRLNWWQSSIEELKPIKHIIEAPTRENLKKHFCI